MLESPQARLVTHYESCLAQHGDSHLGVDWPRLDDAQCRYDVMLGLIRSPGSLLDFGCGAAHLYESLKRRPIAGLQYAGLDLSPRFIELCRAKHPEVTFYCHDLLEGPNVLPGFDYVILNGVLTEKRELSWEAMFAYTQRLLVRIFQLSRIGIAFNVMSKRVDWERDDLFHVPFDTLAEFLCRSLSRHIVVRHDYGLYEYTVYVYREPSSWPR